MLSYNCFNILEIDRVLDSFQNYLFILVYLEVFEIGFEWEINYSDVDYTCWSLKTRELPC